MRFANLSPQATQRLWDKWKHIVRETLDEFNDDVFRGLGVVRENKYCERAYLLLETKNRCLYIFPMPGGAFVLRVYGCKIKNEKLSLKHIASEFDNENFIGRLGLDIALLEERYQELVDEMFQAYLDQALRLAYRNYWIMMSFK